VFADYYILPCNLNCNQSTVMY